MVSQDGVVHRSTAATPRRPSRIDNFAVHPALLAVAERQFGVFAARDALRAGYAEEEIQTEVARRRWVRVRRGVYADRGIVEVARADPAEWHRLQCAAVLIRLGGSPAISHASAALVQGMVVPSGCDDRVRLTDTGQWRRGRGYDVSRATLPQGHLRGFGSFSITSPARTLVDCAREWPLDDAVIAIDAALHAGLLDAVELAGVVLDQTHWNGIGAAARAVGLADGRAESPLETLGRLRIVGSGLPPPELQVEIHDARGFVARVDAWYEEAAVAIEFDGLVKYEDPRDGRSPARVLWDEKRREDHMRGLGVRVVRLARPDLGAAWPRAEKRLVELLASPPGSPRRFRTVRAASPVRRTA
jgi:hypothetical protein